MNSSSAALSSLLLLEESFDHHVLVGFKVPKGKGGGVNLRTCEGQAKETFTLVCLIGSPAWKLTKSPKAMKIIGQTVVEKFRNRGVDFEREDAERKTKSAMKDNKKEISKIVEEHSSDGSDAIYAALRRYNATLQRRLENLRAAQRSLGALVDETLAELYVIFNGERIFDGPSTHMRYSARLAFGLEGVQRLAIAVPSTQPAANLQVNDNLVHSDQDGHAPEPLFLNDCELKPLSLPLRMTMASEAQDNQVSNTATKHCVHVRPAHDPIMTALVDELLLEDVESGAKLFENLQEPEDFFSFDASDDVVNDMTQGQLSNPSFYWYNDAETLRTMQAWLEE